MNGDFRRVSARERILQLASVNASSRVGKARTWKCAYCGKKNAWSSPICAFCRKKKKVKPRRYRNKPCIVDGIRFASGKEAKVYGQLKMRKKIGDIKDFEIQPRFELLLKNEKFRAVHYAADFRVIYQNGKVEIWDVKSEITRKDKVYILKKKMLYRFHKIEIVEK